MTQMTPYQQFIHMSRYSRWIEEKGRRETWDETVDRYINFMCDIQCEGKIPQEVRKELRDAIYNLEIMPSMRAMMTAGPALERDNVAAFNCSYLPIDNPKAFDELMYVLMCGAGVGFSVERQIITKLPKIAESVKPSDTTIVVKDSKIGWAQAYGELISLLYSGRIPRIDGRNVRKAGERLKTFGGRASGFLPLKDLCDFTINVFKNAAGRKLTSIECHDLCCKIGEIVVVGGVRRSAEISLSNLSDDRMRHAKSGDWWKTEPQRTLANNSVAYTEKPGMQQFIQEWTALYESKSGERGIFNREAVRDRIINVGRRDPDYEFGINPCGEIILRPNGFCNLSEVIIRAEDTVEDLRRKVRLTTILGTMQATLTNFRYLRNVWKVNAEEEALLGVSLTGIFDNVLTSGREGKDVLKTTLNTLRDFAIDTNKEWASILGINQAGAVTCTKPSGTVSQLTDCSSGIHPRHSKYFIRNVRADMKDPLALMMMSQGFPWEPCRNKPNDVAVFQFPVKIPDGALTRDDVTTMEHLELWMMYQQEWCEHNPSCTINIKEDEWLKVGSWVYDNFNNIGGLSFLPYSDHVYQQAPYQECFEDEYLELVNQLPKADWSELSEFEFEDNTTGSQTLSCTGGDCEIVDIVKE